MALYLEHGGPAGHVGGRTFVPILGLGECGVRDCRVPVAADGGGERALILSLGVMVLALELINTAIERTVDRISMDHDDLGRQAKDAGSAGVATAAIAAGLAWVVILVG